jgi:hypothetical protein
VQLGDAVKSIQDCMEWGIDAITLFPYNSKIGTQAVHDGVPPISAWLPIEVLRNLDSSVDLSRIYFAWYGNKQQEIGKNIPPITCDSCEDRMAEFYKTYMGEKGNKERRAIVDLMIDSRNCGCYDKLIANTKECQSDTKP